jgi:hypothetical protein
MIRHLKAQRAVALVWLVVILAAVVGGDRSPVAAALNHGDRVPVVLSGLDMTQISRRTDMLMLAVMDPQHNHLSVLPIPRNTLNNLSTGNSQLTFPWFVQFDRRMTSPASLAQVIHFLHDLRGHVHSNLSFWDKIYLAASTRRLRAADVHLYSLPVRPAGASSSHMEFARQLAASLLLGDAARLEEQAGGPGAIVPQADRITINVWNASGQSGLAYRITRKLRDGGFDVVEWGNSPTEQPQTRIVDRRGRISNAQAVANALGIESYFSEPNPDALVDVEVFVGQSFTSAPGENP